MNPANTEGKREREEVEFDSYLHKRIKAEAPATKCFRGLARELEVVLTDINRRCATSSVLGARNNRGRHVASIIP
ncbi:hypothetical protein EYF80_001594 [Liparis tanakae]|uniref:Uncharacterized protein n=1 Tax=Liparis tanakae TaxID=230148 RepID=A0A4Z2JE22_9TELE|nr:hypothetical protein EYF80_001594 [Liparis tanakae]